MSHDKIILIDTADHDQYVCFDCAQRYSIAGLTTIANDLRFSVLCSCDCGRSNHDSND
jgi:hypothetical protein